MAHRHADARVSVLSWEVEETARKYAWACRHEPSDVTGASIFNQRTTEFEFRPGPVFTHVLLADEINRAPPKTLAALLEAMQERRSPPRIAPERSSDPSWCWPPRKRSSCASGSG